MLPFMTGRAYLGIHVEVDDHAIAHDGEEPKEDVDDPKQVVPHGVDGGEGVPVLKDHVFDLIWHKVHHRHALGVAHVGGTVGERGEGGCGV